MTGVPPKVLVLDDHDDPAPYVSVSLSHYPIKNVFYRDDHLVVVLDFHEIYQHFRHLIINPPSSDPSWTRGPEQPW